MGTRCRHYNIEVMKGMEEMKEKIKKRNKMRDEIRKEKGREEKREELKGRENSEAE